MTAEKDRITVIRVSSAIRARKDAIEYYERALRLHSQAKTLLVLSAILCAASLAMLVLT